jgi:peptidoglycan/LPS O-acetylase OafA/YrhL
MIRYVTVVKYGDFRRYAGDRFARIYSVVLPALALTLIFQAISAHFNYTFYYDSFGKTTGHTISHIPRMQALLSQTWFRESVRDLTTITMLSQSWFQDATPVLNSPFWSLSYECVYYALFGICIYLRGTKRILGWIIVFLLIGPTIFLMFPIWLMGAAAYDVYQNGIRHRNSILKLVVLGLLSIVGVHGSYALIEHFHLTRLNFSRVSPLMDIVAIATVAILLPVCIAVRNIPISEKHLFVRGIRRAADATFLLYLIHFPLFVLLAAIVPYSRTSLMTKILLLAAALTLSIVLSKQCKKFKDHLRRLLLRPRAV